MLPNADQWTNFINNSGAGTTYHIQSKLGYSAGIGLAHSFGDQFAINARLLWEQKGFKEEYVTVDGNLNIYNDKIEISNDYFTLNILPTYFFGKKLRFNASVGISYGILRESNDFASYYLNGQLTGQAHGKGQPATYESGILAGIGYSFFAFKKSELNIQLQGNIGLTDTFNQNKYIVRANSISILIMFNINRLSTDVHS